MSEKKIAGRDAFLQALPRVYEDVAVPELGEGQAVRLQRLTAKERAAYEEEITVRTKKGGYELDTTYLQEKLIVACAVGADGQKLFGEEDLPRLAALPAVVITRIFKAAQALCGLGAEEEAAERLKPARG